MLNSAAASPVEILITLPFSEEIIAPLRQVSEFYRHQMPVFGWTQKEENFSNGTQRFTFEKGGDTCYVSIWENWGTKVLIKVLPSAGKHVETGARPAARPAGR